MPDLPGNVLHHPFEVTHQAFLVIHHVGAQPSPVAKALGSELRTRLFCLGKIRFTPFVIKAHNLYKGIAGSGSGHFVIFSGADMAAVFPGAVPDTDRFPVCLIYLRHKSFKNRNTPQRPAYGARIFRMKKYGIARFSSRAGSLAAFIDGNYVRVAVPPHSVVGSQGVSEFYLLVVRTGGIPDQLPVLRKVQQKILHVLHISRARILSGYAIVRKSGRGIGKNDYTEEKQGECRHFFHDFKSLSFCQTSYKFRPTADFNSLLSDNNRLALKTELR